MKDQQAVKEITLLPVNSFELDTHLSDLGLSLAAFAKEYDFTRKCFGVEDCDFIQCALIEFVATLKPYTIPFLAVAHSGYAAGQRVTIKGEHHTEAFITETALHARERGLIIDPVKYPWSFWFRHFVRERITGLRKKLFSLKARQRYKKIEKQTIPEPGPGQFRLLLSTYHPNTIFTLTPVQDALRSREDIFQLYVANRLETFAKLKNLGYNNVINGWALPAAANVQLNRAVFNDFIDRYFEKAFPFGTPTRRFKSKFIERLLAIFSFVSSLYPKLRSVIKNYNPETLLVSSSSTTDSQIMINLMKGTGGKVLEMTHGIFQDTPLLKLQHVPVKLVWNERQKDLIQMYNNDIVCHVVGNPKHDDLLQKFEKSPPPNVINKPYVLLVSSPGRNTSLSWATYIDVLSTYIAVARQFSDFEFIYKLHPSENPIKIKSEVNRLNAPSNFVIEKEVNVYDLILYAEIVVVATSSVGFEALLWDKKIICYVVPNSERWLPFPAFNLAKQARNLQELDEAIQYFKKHQSLTIGNKYRDYFAFSQNNSLDTLLDFVLKRNE